MRYRITEAGFGRLNEQERLELSRLLVKAGYAVKQGREKPNPKNTTYKYYIEYWEDKNESV